MPGIRTASCGHTRPNSASGYVIHRQRNEPACDACRQARCDYLRLLNRRRNPNARARLSAVQRRQLESSQLVTDARAIAGRFGVPPRLVAQALVHALTEPAA